MSAVLTQATLRTALALDGFDGRRAQRLMEPARRGRVPEGASDGPPRPAAALAYVFSQEGRLALPLTVRRADLPEHRGQVSLPGGRPHAGESLWETALRETEEEIGLRVEGIRLLEQLAPVHIPVTYTRLHVHVATGPDPGELVACPREVERIRIVPLDDLLSPSRRAVRRLRIEGVEIDVPFFDVQGLFLWGATARRGRGPRSLRVPLPRCRFQK